MPMKAQANPGFALGGDVGNWVKYFLNQKKKNIPVILLKTPDYFNFKLISQTKMSLLFDCLYTLELSEMHNHRVR